MQERRWNVLLGVGAVAGTFFLGLYVWNFTQDAARPLLRDADEKEIFAAVLALATVGLLALKRVQIRRAASLAAERRAARSEVRAERKARAKRAVATRKRRRA